MIFIVLLLVLFFLRMALRMVGSVLLVALVLVVLVDESRIHPELGKMLWAAVAEVTEKVAEWSRAEAGSLNQIQTFPSKTPATRFDSTGAGYY